MTEDEAKTKTCHRTLVPFGNSAGNPAYGPAACIASACMAWRWIDAATEGAHGEGATPPAGEGWMLQDDKGETYRDPRFRTYWERPMPDRRGYCGLAGAPQ